VPAMVEAQVVGLMKMPVGFVNMCNQPRKTAVIAYGTIFQARQLFIRPKSSNSS
jgi:hypothetical protein